MLSLEENEEYIVFTQTTLSDSIEERSFPLSLNLNEASFPSDYFNKYQSKPITLSYSPNINTKTHDDISKAVRNGLSESSSLSVECVISFLHTELKTITDQVQGDWNSNGIIIAYDQEIISPLDLLSIQDGNEYVLSGDTGSNLTAEEKNECLWALIVANRIASVISNLSPDYRATITERLKQYFLCPPWNIKSLNFTTLGIKAAS